MGSRTSGRPSQGGHDFDAKLAEFARLIAEARDLEAIFDYFHNELVRSDGFMRAGVPGQQPRLQNMCRILLRVMNAGPPQAPMTLIQVPGHGFWHGCMMLANTGAALVNYFEAINRGFFCYTKSLAEPRAHFIRFSIPDDLSADLDTDSLKLESITTRPRGGYLPV